MTVETAGLRRVVDILLGEFDEVAAAGEPRLVVLEGETGLGKTRALQEFHDALAAGTSQQYWKPGLIAPTAPDSDAQLDERRKRILDWQLCDGNALPGWLWLAVQGAPLARDGGVGADPVAFNLIPQLERHVTWMGSRLSRKQQAWIAVRKLTGTAVKLFTPAFISELTSLKADLVDAAQKGLDANEAASKLVQAWGAASRAVSPEDAAQAEARAARRRRRAFLSLLDLFHADAGSAGLPVVIVVDDAQDVDENLLYLLADIVTQRNPVPQIEGSVYVDPGTPASRRPVLLIATAWPHRTRVHRALGSGFGKWLEEIGETGVPVTVVAAGDAGLPRGLTGPESVAVLQHHLPGLVQATAERIAAASVDDQGFHNPLVVMLHVVRYMEATRLTSAGLTPAAPSVQILDEWLRRLPRHPQEPARLRFGQLPEPAQRALLVGSLVGRTFPRLAAVRALVDVEGISPSIDVAIRPHAYVTDVEPRPRLSPLAGQPAAAADGPAGAEVLRLLAFADELCHDHAATTAGKDFSAHDLTAAGLASWLEEVLDLSRRDLDDGVAWLDFDEWRWVVAQFAARYLALAKSPRPAQLELFARAVLLLDAAVERGEAEIGARAPALRELVVHDVTEQGVAWLHAVNALLFVAEATRGRLDMTILEGAVARATELAPRSRLAHGIASQVLRRTDATDQLKTAAADLLRKNVRYAAAAMALATWHEGRNELREAEEALVGASNASVVLVRRARLLRALGDRDAALRLLQSALESRPTAFLTRVYASLLEEIGRPDAAAEALAEHSDEASVRQRARILRDSGLRNAALRVLEDAGQTLEAPGLAADRGLLLADMQRFDEALAVLEPFVTHEDALLAKLDVLERAGRAAELDVEMKRLGGALRPTGMDAPAGGDSPFGQNLLLRITKALRASAVSEQEIADLARWATTPDTAHAVARLLTPRGQRDRALTLLRPHERRPTCATLMASLLAQERRFEAAAEVVRPHAASHAPAAILWACNETSPPRQTEARELVLRTLTGARPVSRRLAFRVLMGNVSSAPHVERVLGPHGELRDEFLRSLVAHASTRERDAWKAAGLHALVTAASDSADVRDFERSWDIALLHAQPGPGKVNYYPASALGELCRRWPGEAEPGRLDAARSLLETGAGQGNAHCMRQLGWLALDHGWDAIGRRILELALQPGREVLGDLREALLALHARYASDQPQPGLRLLRTDRTPHGEVYVWVVE